jgi:hypothetical protein
VLTTVLGNRLACKFCTYVFSTWYARIYLCMFILLLLVLLTPLAATAYFVNSGIAHNAQYLGISTSAAYSGYIKEGLFYYIRNLYTTFPYKLKSITLSTSPHKFSVGTLNISPKLILSFLSLFTLRQTQDLRIKQLFLASLQTSDYLSLQ